MLQLWEAEEMSTREDLKDQLYNKEDVWICSLNDCSIGVIGDVIHQEHVACILQVVNTITSRFQNERSSKTISILDNFEEKFKQNHFYFG